MPTGAGEVQNLTAVETLDRQVDQFSLRIDHRLGNNDQLLARFSTFDARDIQPFGTSVQQESLVPGFGRALDTTTRNLGVSYSRTIGGGMLNEFRFGWMRVEGGQQSLNAGNDFAGRVGLLGVTRDPRDTGFPQINTAGLYSVMGDPATFIARNNEHFELYNNFLIDRGEHRLKFGAYLFHPRFRPENPDSARGAFTYTGQFTRPSPTPGMYFRLLLIGYFERIDSNRQRDRRTEARLAREPVSVVRVWAAPCGAVVLSSGRMRPRVGIPLIPEDPGIKTSDRVHRGRVPALKGVLLQLLAGDFRMDGL